MTRPLRVATDCGRHAVGAQISITVPQERRNGGPDHADAVLRLYEPFDGHPFQIPGDPSTPGRAVARIRQPPFRSPAVAASGKLVAFLEPETAQGNADSNGDGRL